MLSLIQKVLSESARGLRALPDHEGQIVAFHNSRCGSTVLGNLLRQHPMIEWDGEVFAGMYPSSLAQHLAEALPVLYLRQRRLRRTAPFYGFEFKPRLHGRKIRPPLHVFLSRLRRLRGNRYVLITRENNLRRRVSLAVGKKTKRWNISRKDEPALVRVKLDVSDLKRYLDRMDEEFKEVERYLDGEEVLRLSYEEDVLPDPRIGYRRLCSFLGVEARPATVHNRKMNPFPLTDIIENYGEVEQALGGTSHEWMLYED